MRICVVAVDDVFDTGLATLLDTFEVANDLAGESRACGRITASRSPWSRRRGARRIS